MDDKPPPYGSVMGYQQAAPYPPVHPVQSAPYPAGPAAAPYPANPTMPGAAYSHPYPDPQSQPYGEYSASAGNAFTSSARFSDKSVRHAFIRKVYLILTAQLLVTCGIVSLFLLAHPVKYWVQRNSWFYYISYATFLVTYITLVCCDNVRRRFPGNFIALSVFTLAFSYVAGTIASFHNTDSVLIAVGITAAVCLGISLFAIQTRIDFTKCTALIFVLSLVVLLTGLACMIVYMVSGPNKILHVVYGGLAALLFGLYLAFDTQMIMGGRKHELSPEEYIYGALQLYLDVVYLFMIILSLVGSKD
ncbi:fas apoptotic inhibitory molecule 2 [Clonorchis sinensis]|uniref:Fas apoptotic inhibitory molecule 2 n=1 Tax=Clonorchis sinensis TaxID=79923 RepID=G7Y2U8_CLOSI|nr:fas apoptotic inhibitory molecule 2 [Clonorchis sinensis]